MGRTEKENQASIVLMKTLMRHGMSLKTIKRIFVSSGLNIVATDKNALLLMDILTLQIA
jgi:hypothetical protein